MSSIVSNTATENFHDIISKGANYKVPCFQRDYSWGREQWEDLWEDIETLPECKAHYMGYLVLQKDVASRTHIIIDGQQRLTTLSLIVLSAVQHLHALSQNDADAPAKRAQLIRELYIGKLDPVSLNAYNKLKLNRHNDSIFRNLAALDEPNLRKAPKTNRLIKQAYDFFWERLKKLAQKSDKADKAIAAFVERMSDGLIFTVIMANDDINAYAIFETLNARGVQLSTPDLLKNYLFSVIYEAGCESDEEMDILEEKWATILEQLEKNSFAEFIRVNWNMQYPLTAKSALFKHIKKQVHTRGEAYPYLHQLKKNAPIYAALLNDTDEVWQPAAYSECKKSIAMLDIFKIKRPLSLLLVAYHKFSAAEFERLMRYIVVLSMRYQIICNRCARELEKEYNKLALAVNQGKYTRASHVKNDKRFRNLYPSDIEFETHFQKKQILGVQATKKIRYILTAIEAKQSGVQPDMQTITVEHILPQEPTEKWVDTFGANWEACINRLGNMTLLTKEANKTAGRKLFAAKKSLYEQSTFSIAKRLSIIYDTWDAEAVDHYQDYLATLAVETWKIDYSRDAS